MQKKKTPGSHPRKNEEKQKSEDKPVSKGDGAHAPPGLSIYRELCSIFRISINEFLAGEDIGTENVIEKSDSNLIQITKESKKKQKKFKNNSCCSNCFAVIVSAILGTLFFHKLIHPKIILPQLIRQVLR